MRKTNSLVFFLNPSKKREKVPALSKSLRARARSVSQRTRRSARGKNGRNLSRTFTCTRSCAFYSREFFFLSSFPFPKRRYFSIFLLFFRRNWLRKRGKWERKRRHKRSDERKRGVFFCFLAGKICLCFAQKHTDMNHHHVLCKGGGRGVQLAFAAFYFVQRR